MYVNVYGQNQQNTRNLLFLHQVFHHQHQMSDWSLKVLLSNERHHSRVQCGHHWEDILRRQAMTQLLYNALHRDKDIHLLCPGQELYFLKHYLNQPE